MELKAKKIEDTISVVKQDVQNLRIDSKELDIDGEIKEVPSIRLSPDQIEEIHTDEYSLTLFYATRVQPLSLDELKRQFPEPEAKKAQSVMDRYMNAGLVYLTPDKKYYSYFPENYINYSNYRYDGDLEAKKDAKVFQLMKEYTGKKEYWTDKTYFSMDAFFTEEQSQELIQMFKNIKLKAKHYSNKNTQNKNIHGLKFRRIKFYDMIFSFLLLILFNLALIPALASAGGNDPTARMSKVNFQFDSGIVIAGGGNDPSMPQAVPTGKDGGGGHDPAPIDPKEGGGGHDPASGSVSYENCKVQVNGKFYNGQHTCKVESLLNELPTCGAMKKCDLALKEINFYLDRLVN